MKQTKVEHWIENLRAHPSGIFTKKELSQITGLSDNTVYETLKAAGLDTKAISYTLVELLERFVPARQMLDEGKTYEDVDNHFKGATVVEQEDATSLEEAVGALQVSVYEDAKAIISELMKPIAPYIPALIVHGLASLYDSKESMQAMQQARTQFIKGIASPILDQHVRGKKRLGGSTVNKALPESSSQGEAEGS